MNNTYVMEIVFNLTKESFLLKEAKHDFRHVYRATSLLARYEPIPCHYGTPRHKKPGYNEVHAITNGIL